MPIFPLRTLRDQPAESRVDDTHHDGQQNFRNAYYLSASRQDYHYKPESDQQPRKHIEKYKLEDFHSVGSSNVDPHDVCWFLSPADCQVELVLKVAFYFVSFPRFGEQVAAPSLGLDFVDEFFWGGDVFEGNEVAV